jgi:acyl-CoA thioesterase I
MKRIMFLLLFTLTLILSCSSERAFPVADQNTQTNVPILPIADATPPETTPQTQKNYKILSLGDSYTIGQSVCETCRFPEQLKAKLVSKFDANTSFELKIIARTGWTTSNLISAIASENPSQDFDLVTLLIGVNNQYQGKLFSLYETEFVQLINIAKSKAKGDKRNIIVISIPDYAYTPFGNGNATISAEIDKYNLFAKSYCDANDITYINITDITRLGLITTELVASDGLHPSALAYSRFVDRIAPLAIEKLKD